MGVLDAVIDRLFGSRDPIASAAALADFMDSRAAFMAQKCVVEFSRVRVGVYWQKLFSEKEFQSALDLSRWRSYPAAFGMVAEMVEAALRPAAGIRRTHLPAALSSLARSVFARYPVPDGLEPDFWQKAEALVTERLQAGAGEAARAVREMPKPLARIVFDALPMHREIVTNDYDYIFNNLRMNLLRAHEDFIRIADLPALADDLLGPR
ncbi:MAG: hypothetical protein KF723_07440 [Rhizobiaceae bacterium]|nr:hypothetical protein [Rhizobiaceae bacterium]